MSGYKASSNTSKRTNKPPSTSASSEGGLLGGSSVYLTSMSNYGSSVVPADGSGGVSAVNGLPSGGISLGAVVQVPPDGSNGLSVFPKEDPFAKYFSGSAHVNDVTSGSVCAGGSTFSASQASSTSRLESMLNRVTSLESNNGAKIFLHPTNSTTASVSGSSGFASGGHPAQITMETALQSSALSRGSYQPTSAAMVTRPGLSGGLDSRLVPDSMSQGMMGTGSAGITSGLAESFLPQKYLSQ